MYGALRNLTALCVLLTVVACGQSGPSEEELNAARESELTALEQAKTELDQKREELAQVQAKAATGEADADSGETAEQLKARAEGLAMEVEDAATKLGGQLVELINKYPPVQGEPLDAFQERAIGMKIKEDLLLAQEWIDRGGDYKRAISILEGLQPLAPDNEDLNAALANAREMRFMTAERFAQVKKGMSEEQVRSLLGPVNLRNVKTYPERNVVLWLYPREDGSAAGVYFGKDKGQNRVYSVDFDAVKKGHDEQGG